MDIELQKEVSKSVLDKIKYIDHRAIIAGGAPRDWYFDNLANDIDIFYYFDTGLNSLSDDDANVNLLKFFYSLEDVKILGFNNGKEPQEDFNNYLKNPDIKNVYECTIDGIKFQFISLMKRNVNVNNFAYNMCQAWSDGEFIYTTRKFDTGVKKKILIETGELYSNTERFKQKMISKFPDYDYIEK